MKPVLASLGLAALFGCCGMPTAGAWTRSESFSTPRGIYYGRLSGGCREQTCARMVSIIGPDGGTFSQLESISRVGPNSYEYSRTITDPNGHSVTRSGTLVPPPDDCDGFWRSGSGPGSDIQIGLRRGILRLGPPAATAGS